MDAVPFVCDVFRGHNRVFQKIYANDRRQWLHRWPFDKYPLRREGLFRAMTSREESIYGPHGRILTDGSSLVVLLHKYKPEQSTGKCQGYRLVLIDGSDSVAKIRQYQDLNSATLAGLVWATQLLFVRQSVILDIAAKL